MSSTRLDLAPHADFQQYQAPNPGIVKRNAILNTLNWLFGKKICFAVLPAQFVAKNPNLGRMLYQLENNIPVNTTRLIVITHDNAELDAVEIMPRSLINKANDHKVAILKFNGNGAQYEDHLEDLAYDAVKLNCTVVGFNYRGVGNSLGTPDSEAKLLTDGCAQVQRLLDLGYTPKPIVLDDISLGAGFATLVAAHFLSHGVTPNVMNDRSFSSITAAATDMILGQELSSSLISTSLRMSSSSSIASSIYSADFQVKAANAYLTLPSANKCYMYVSKKANHGEGDGVIPPSASLHRGVKNKVGQGEYHYKLTAQSLFGDSCHNARRHNLQLANDSSRTAQDVFEEFVTRVTR